MKKKIKDCGAFAELQARTEELGIDQLSLNDVLDALEQDGIKDLKQLVENQLKKAKELVKEPENINLFTATKTISERYDHIVHRPPAMMVIIDGVQYDPEDIKRFDGTPLYFVAPADDYEQALHAFTGDQWKDAIRVYSQTRFLLSLLDVMPKDFDPTPPMGPYGPGPGPLIGPIPPIYPPTGPSIGPMPPILPPTTPPYTPPPSPPTEAQFFSDINFKGDWLWLGPRLQWSDLTKVSRGNFLFFSDDWNDVISSVIAHVGLIALCEHINLGGSAFYIQSGRWVSDLSIYGWNDRTSSIVNWG